MIENRKRRPSVTTQGNVSYEQVTNYDEWSRPSLMRTRPAGASNGDALEWTCAYSYDVAGRLDSITDSQVSENPFIYIENELCHCCDEYTVRILVGEDHLGSKTIKRAIEPYPHLKRGEEWSDKFTCPGSK